MESFAHVIRDAEGLHARSCVVVSREAAKWKSNITVRNESGIADAKSISSLLMLHAKRGEGLCVSCEGADERQAASALEVLMRMSV
ncbi:MAG: HPr family phosphocarrier protein [Atopobiaceae bacterium]|nr:HPr family phosphocarrier protein [Atopobiaceae bacterium]